VVGFKVSIPFVDPKKKRRRRRRRRRENQRKEDMIVRGVCVHGNLSSLVVLHNAQTPENWLKNEYQWGLL
jgi:hypothetical protein